MSANDIHSQHKLSELISILQNIKDDHGDLPVVFVSRVCCFIFDDFADQALWLVEDIYILEDLRQSDYNITRMIL